MWMGASKRAVTAGSGLRGQDHRHRSGSGPARWFASANVLGVFRFGGCLCFVSQIASGGPLTVTHPEITPLLHDHSGGASCAAGRASPGAVEVLPASLGATVCASLTSRARWFGFSGCPTPRRHHPDGDISIQSRATTGAKLY